jgi:curved DNA-binding protein CbpA
MKNYYSVLGVLPSVDTAVIKAAWRALCQIYHPDKYQGDKAHGEALIKEFNEAWAVLGDPERRKQYDSQFGAGKGTFQETSEEHSSPISFKEELLGAFPELELVGEYYPDIWKTIEDLQSISRQLASGFVAALLETKAFKDRAALALALEDDFFTAYFGKNEAILRFARQLVILGAKEAALELNKAVNLFGHGIEPGMVIERIDKKYGVSVMVKNKEHADDRTQKQRQEVAKREKDQRMIERAFHDLKFLRPNIVKNNLDTLMAASSPLRDALKISTIFERETKGLFSSFAGEIIVFTRQGQKWKVKYEPEALTEWTYDTLIPLAIGEFNISY